MKLLINAIPRSRAVTALTLSLVMAGCASVGPDGGFGAVSGVAQERLNMQTRWERTHDDARISREHVARLLDASTHGALSADDAVQIALLNNRNLQAAFAGLGIGEAQVIAAGSLPGLHLSTERIRERPGPDIDIKHLISFNLLSLLTLPARLEAEQAMFARTQRMVAGEVVSLAHETRIAYFQAVAAAQTAAYMGQVQQAAEAGSELARQMRRAGHFSNLQQAREQMFYADATAQLARARHASVAAREKLTRLMGLWGEQTNFRLPDTLPKPPKERAAYANIEATAMARRLDLQAAKTETAAVASAAGLTQVTRFVDAIELGFVRERGSTGSPKTGYEIGLQIPLFDFGQSKVRRAEAVYMQAAQRYAQTAIDARSEVREAWSAYNTSYDLASHYRDEVVPLKKRISDEMLLKYNGMLSSVFDLLADAREQVMAVNASIEAQRDFWIAESTLQTALTGKPGAMMGMEVKGGSANEMGKGH
jgi:outer membrane protein TolC